MTPQFQTGTPDTPPGSRRAFWCATLNDQGKLFHRYLEYLNAHVMPLADSQDEAGPGAVAIGEDGDYAFTGWYEPSCDQCETQWQVTNTVLAWLILPKFTPAT